MMMYPPPPPNVFMSPYLPAPVTSEEGPLPSPMRGLWPGRYNRITGIVLIGVVLIAIVAAVLGPLLTAQSVSTSAAPSGWSKVYTSNLQNTSDWTGDSGCSTGPGGLDVTSGSNGWDVCTFTPSANADLVSQGFQLNVALAAESQLQQPLSPLLQITDSNGDGVSVLFDDTGDFAICQDTGQDCSACLSGSFNPCADVLASDSTDAWHTDSYVPNTLAIRYQPNNESSGTLTVFANGQEITRGSLANGLSSGFSIAIGSGDSGEALYTGATLYTPSS